MYVSSNKVLLLAFRLFVCSQLTLQIRRTTQINVDTLFIVLHEVLTYSCLFFAALVVYVTVSLHVTTL